jgi:glycosyltransferase involved in cell wall biosynthesis
MSGTLGVTGLAGSARIAASRRTPAGRIRVANVITGMRAGAGGITLRGALALDPDLYTTTILAAEGGTLIDRAEEAGLEVIELRHMSIGRGVYPWTDSRAFREIATHLEARGFDLVHTHSTKAGALGRLAARRVGVPTVVHSFHGFPFHEFQSPVVRGALQTFERRLARITDYFLTDGTIVAAEAVRLKIASPDRIRAIASPVDDIPRASEASRRESRRLLGIPASAKLVGTAGRLESQKAPLDMVKAVASMGRRDVYLVWAGDGPLRGKTERLIERNGLRDRFLLLGERKDVARLLPGFDVFAMSSLFEGLPCAIVEAMTCGIPVVATAVNSVPEIVVPGKKGLVVRPSDPPSLGRALAYLLDHPGEAARMAEAAGVHIGDRFRPEVLGRDLHEVYEIAARLSSARLSSAHVLSAAEGTR